MDTKPLAELEANADSLTLDDLQQQKNLRDAEVMRLRAEMAEIHALMEPKWERQRRDTAGPANLRQVVKHG